VDIKTRARATRDALNRKLKEGEGAMGNLVYIVVVVLAIIFVLYLLGVLQVSPIR